MSSLSSKSSLPIIHKMEMIFCHENVGDEAKEEIKNINLFLLHFITANVSICNGGFTNGNLL